MYYSSRNHEYMVSASQALLQGLSPDGGLFLIDNIPSIILKREDLSLSYKELSLKILKKYFDDFTEEEIKSCIDKAYNEHNFNEKIIGVKSFENYSFLELFYGPTLAFKDMALTLLPHLLEVAMKKENINRLKIITATSGDTGSAALSGFSQCDNIEISVLYPYNGISKIQEKQMLYFTNQNARAYSLKNGNFDDCQKLAKECLAKKDLNINLSSANSINIGRLIPQIIYYYASYIELVNTKQIEFGSLIDVIVPTGNFGNIFACYLAKQMGLPINHLICASNKNNVLDDFFKTGIYDARREFYITNSPSMDILVSSNLERLLCLVCKETELKEYMKELKDNHYFAVSNNIKAKLNDFLSFTINEEETLKCMKQSFDDNQYLIDPHTAVSYGAYLKYRKNTSNYCMVVATASYYKFPLTVKKALNLKENDEIKLLDEISKLTGSSLPKSLYKVINDDTPKYVIGKKEYLRRLTNKPAFKISTPASSANLACGFDVCGLSYNLFNTYEFKQAEDDTLIGFEERYEKDNLVLKAYQYVFKKHSLPYTPIKITLLEQNIPASRGLGSSSSCIVAGVLAANQILNNKFSTQELLNMMCELEGHPDNVACTYLGGFVSSFKDGEQYYFSKVKVSNNLKFILCIPEYELSTSLARGVLPKSYSLADVTYNTSRIINLPSALKSGDVDMLNLILKDKIHQPYRFKLIPDAEKIQEIAKANSLPLVISGAGSTLLIIAKSADVIKELESKEYSVKYRFVCLDVNEKGSVVKE